MTTPKDNTAESTNQLSAAQSKARLLLSAAVAFSFYFGWAYWANMADSIPKDVTLRAAFVQGTYSGLVTLVFTWLLERSVHRLGAQCYSLAFMVPITCKFHSGSRQNQAVRRVLNHGLSLSAGYFSGARLPGAILAPLLPLTIQSAFVLLVNYLNHTPNLWLTVAPSLFFSAVYGYSYTFALLKKNDLKLP